MSLTLLCFPVFKVLLKIQIIIHEVCAEARVYISYKLLGGPGDAVEQIIVHKSKRVD